MILIFILFISIFSYIYRFSTINIYNNILLILTLITVVSMAIFLFEVITIFIVYKRNRVGKVLIIPLKLALRILPSFITVFSIVFKKHREELVRFYIEVNNISIQSGNKKYDKDDILILLPHCLQYSECPYKITRTINNCKRCGKCSIGKLSEIGCEKGLQVRVVTGGTAARNIVEKLKPKIILSVACERDLLSGIVDVKKIPVLGVLNKRPNGPCFNTTVDLDKIEEKLESILKK